MLTHFSLFSGIGGIDLAAEWAGFKTVGQCEWADYPRKVLEKHWPDVPRWRDIREVTAESFTERTGLSTVTVVSGGFPCQPFSVAGKRRGKEDDRYLWPEMFRVISELRPSWVVGENVAGIISLALDTVLSDLENQGYEVQPFLIPACGVNAPHRRNRTFIVAYSNEIMAYANGAGCKEFNIAQKPKEQGHGTGNIIDGRIHWAVEPNVGRVANGIPNRVDRLKCLGNAVVPQQVYPILKAIAEIEKQK